MCSGESYRWKWTSAQNPRFSLRDIGSILVRGQVVDYWKLCLWFHCKQDLQSRLWSNLGRSGRTGDNLLVSLEANNWTDAFNSNLLDRVELWKANHPAKLETSTFLAGCLGTSVKINSLTFSLSQHNHQSHNAPAFRTNQLDDGWPESGECY